VRLREVDSRLGVIEEGKHALPRQEDQAGQGAKRLQLSSIVPGRRGCTLDDPVSSIEGQVLGTTYRLIRSNERRAAAVPGMRRYAPGSLCYSRLSHVYQPIKNSKSGRDRTAEKATEKQISIDNWELILPYNIQAAH
jgi:hypothetical protein